MSVPVIKVCGMKDPENIQSVLNAQPDWMGFIFYETSPRCVLPENYDCIAKIQGVKKVGVFVNKTCDEIFEIANQCALDMIQLHGDESPEFCSKISEKHTVIKAVSVRTAEDLNQTVHFINKINYFLFDTKKKGYRGGTGEQFNWQILEAYNGEIPFLLSGGISLNDVEKVKAFRHPQYAGVDINSGFEISPGVKDATDIAKFVQEVKHS